MPYTNSIAGQTWSDVLASSLTNLWDAFLRVVPTLLLSIIILVLGWIVALALEQVIARLLKALRLNQAFDRAGAMNPFHRADMRFDVVALIAALVRWFVFFVFLMAVADVLHLTAFNDFLRQVVLYVPNIILAALILLVVTIGGDLLDRFVSGSIRAAGFSYGSFVGAIARWSVFVFGVIAALQQLGIATELLQTFVTGIIAMLAIAGGLAFGLGGRDLAQDILHQVRKRMQ